MDAATIITTILGVINIATKAMEAGKDAAPFLQALFDRLGGKKVADVTQDDLDALEAKIDAMSEELQLPLPPEPDAA